MQRALEKPIAAGRTAEIYPWEEGTVLKLFYDWFDVDSIRYEAQIAQAVSAIGVPAPAVGEIIQVNGRNALVYERLDGSAMWAVMARNPFRLVRCAHSMAAIHAAMHLRGMGTELPPQRQRLLRKIEQAQALPAHLRSKVLAVLESLPDGDRLCHGDFHPQNILITPGGERVIDWMDATRGNPLADVARTSILILGAAATNQTPNLWMKILVRGFHWIYLRRYFQLRPGGEAEYRRWLPVVAAARLSEQIPELEQWLIANVGL